MKRISILGLLAIIVAVASSFSTTFKKVPNDAWFLLSASTLPSQSDFQTNYSSAYNRVSAYDATKRTQAAVQTICGLGSQKVCAVKIDYEVDAPTDALDDNGGTPGTGDFTNDYTIDILGYELKNP